MHQPPTSFDPPHPVVLDLFSGAGGMGLGFQMAGYTIGLGVDNDPKSPDPLVPSPCYSSIRASVKGRRTLHHLPGKLRRYDNKSRPQMRNECFRDRYRKLVRNKPSWTPEGQIGEDIYRHIYPSREGEPEPPRTSPVREAARLQSNCGEC